MGQQQSKDELLYHQVNYQNVEGIKALRQEGAGLEWLDREAKTPLIVACMNPELFTVAKTLIELGANVNAYRPGGHAGTPLHHAAKRGLEQTTKLLLSNGANALVMNDDCQTPLDIARAKGFSKVVRAIESHLCLFSGWLRELYGPDILEALSLAPHWLSRKIWAVVTPCGSVNQMKALKLELAIYSSQENARPRVVIPLWKANVEEPKLHQSDPVLILFDKAAKSRYKLASANEGDKHQLQWFLNACRGIPQVMRPSDAGTPVVPPATAPSSKLSNAEDIELAMAINASIQSAMQERPPLLPDTHLTSGGSSANSLVNSTDNHNHNGWGPSTVSPVPPSKATTSGWLDKPAEDTCNGWSVIETGSSSNQAPNNPPAAVSVTSEIPETVSVPSAPPIPEGTDDGPVHYPSIDISPVNLSTPTVDDNKPAGKGAVKEDVDTSSCVICLDAPVEGACIPCGHMAGCMSCLKEIKAKKWGCPVCRAKIDQVIRLYTV